MKPATILCLYVLSLLGCDQPQAESPVVPAPTNGKIVAMWYTPGYVGDYFTGGRTFPATYPERWTVKIQSDDGRTNEIPVDSYDYHRMALGQVVQADHLAGAEGRR